MSNEDNVITLPEITIEGSTGAQSMNASDWWCEGFTKGFNAPDTAVERPLMINDELAASFFAGVDSGQKANKDIEAEFNERYCDSQQVVPDIGGEAYEEALRRYREAWEALFHEHTPHTEVEVEPGPPFVRPNIIIVPE
jgi:hypothetical protein